MRFTYKQIAKKRKNKNILQNARERSHKKKIVFAIDRERERMAGTAVTPSPAAGSMTGLNIGANVSASFVNSFRVAAVAERLSTHVQPDFVSDDVEFFNLCLSLARYLFF